MNDTTTTSAAAAATTRKRDPQTPVTATSSYISPGQRSRRSNEAILQEIYLRVEEQDDGDDDDAVSFSEDVAALQDMVITTSTATTAMNQHNNNSWHSELSAMTEEVFRRTTTQHQQSRTCTRELSGLPDIEDNISEVSLEPKRQQELNALFTFRRRDVRYEDDCEVGEGTCTIFETTLNARTCGPDEESMEALVKRLQQKGRASGVLKFNRGLIQKIRAGEKEVVFVLVQVKGAKFSKEEFGRMMASEVAGLTQERPIVVEIQTENAVEGETLDVF